MIKFIFFFLSLLVGFNVAAQIDLEAGTVQSIAYWEIHESQKYKITETETTSRGRDTLSISFMTYDVNIKVVDTVATGYTLEWTRNNSELSSMDPLGAKLNTLLDEFPIQLSTDIFGSSLQVINWENIGTRANNICVPLLAENKEKPAALQRIRKALKLYESKDAIESLAIHDVKQYFVYHGAKYLLGETVKSDIKVPNNYGGDPLDAVSAIVLDEILPQNDTYIIKSFQNINAQQLKAVTYDYLKKIDIVGQELPAYEDFPTLLKQIWGGSEIHGSSGWVIYSQESQQITSGEDITIDERIIEMLK